MYNILLEYISFTVYLHFVCLVDVPVNVVKHKLISQVFALCCSRGNSVCDLSQPELSASDCSSAGAGGQVEVSTQR